MFLLNLNASFDADSGCQDKSVRHALSKARLHNINQPNNKIVYLRDQLQSSIHIESQHLNKVTYLLSSLLQLEERRSASYHIKLSKALEYEASVYNPVRQELEEVKNQEGEKSISDYPHIKLFIEHFDVFTFGFLNTTSNKQNIADRVKSYFTEFRDSKDFSHYQLFNRRYKDVVRNKMNM